MICSSFFLLMFYWLLVKFIVYFGNSGVWLLIVVMLVKICFGVLVIR